MGIGPAILQPNPTLTDPFGTRRRRTNGSDAETVLEIRPELSNVGSFEFAVRERAARLAAFRHRSFVPVCRVERTPGREGSLTIVSSGLDGTLLHDALTTAGEHGIAVPAEWAVGLIRQLVEALSALHAMGTDVSHGVLAPHCILIDSAADALISDYVLGPAVEQLRFSGARYWTDLGVPTGADAPEFDQPLDMFQVGVLALSLLTARPASLEHFGREMLHDRIRSVTVTSQHAAVVPEFQRWLGRALRLDSPFRSALDARVALEQFLAQHTFCAGAAAAQDWFVQLERLRNANGPGGRPPSVADAPPGNTELATSPATANRVDEPTLPSATCAGAAKLQDRPVVHVPTAAADSARSEPGMAGELPLSQPSVEADASAVTQAPQWEEPRRRTQPIFTNDRGRPPQSKHRVYWRVGVAAAAVGAVVLWQGGRHAADASSSRRALETWSQVRTMFGGIGRTPQAFAVLPATPVSPGVRPADRALPPALPETGTLEVRTQPAGAQVSIDDVNAGHAPVTLTTSAGQHTVVIVGDSGSVKDVVTVQRGGTTSLVVPLAKATPAVGGWISVASPLDVQLFDEGRLIGTSGTDRVMLPAGMHQLEIVNAPSGYRAHRTVTVVAGKVSPVTIAVPKGLLAINALPWAEVWLDGERLGATPIGNVAVSIGEHELVFRHPTLGEQHRRVVVPVVGIARTGVDMNER